MCTALDDASRLASILRADLNSAFHDVTDAFYRRTSSLCDAQWLVHNRHCRRIYHTLCKFCKPEELVVEARQTTTALCQAWSSTQSICGDTAAEIVSLLMNTNLGDKVGDKRFAITLLLLLIESDMNFLAENVSVMERSLERLRSDVERERVETLDATAQRKALRKRRLQRVLALQLRRERCTEIFELVSQQLLHSLEKAKRLQIDLEKLHSLQETDVVSSRDRYKVQEVSFNCGLSALQQLVLKLKAHEKLQSDCLSKAHRVRNDIVELYGEQWNSNFSYMVRRQTAFQKQLRGNSVNCSENDFAGCLLMRAGRLLHSLCEEGSSVHGIGLNEHCKQDVGFNRSVFSALSAYQARLRRHAVEHSLSMTCPQHSLSGFEETLQNTVGTHREKTFKIGHCAEKQCFSSQQCTGLRPPRNGDVEMSYDEGSFGHKNLHCPDPTTEDGVNICASMQSGQLPKTDVCLNDGKRSVQERLQSTSLGDVPETTLPLSSERESVAANGFLPSLGHNHQAAEKHNIYRDDPARTAQPHVNFGEEYRINLTRSKALLLARLTKLAYMNRTLTTTATPPCHDP